MKEQLLGNMEKEKDSLMYTSLTIARPSSFAIYISLHSLILICKSLLNGIPSCIFANTRIYLSQSLGTLVQSLIHFLLLPFFSHYLQFQLQVIFNYLLLIWSFKYIWMLFINFTCFLRKIWNCFVIKIIFLNLNLNLKLILYLW